MLLRCTAGPIDDLAVDTICVSLFADERPPQGSTGLVDWRLCGAISRGLLEGRFRGDLDENLLIHSGGRVAAERILVSGTGASAGFGYDRLARVAEGIARTLAGMRVKSVGLTLPGVALAGLDYAVAAGRLFDAFAKQRAGSDWLTDLDAHVVVHESRLAEVYCQFESAATGKTWVQMEGRRFRCERS